MQETVPQKSSRVDRLLQDFQRVKGLLESSDDVRIKEEIVRIQEETRKELFAIYREENPIPIDEKIDTTRPLNESELFQQWMLNRRPNSVNRTILTLLAELPPDTELPQKAIHEALPGRHRPTVNSRICSLCTATADDVFSVYHPRQRHLAMRVNPQAKPEITRADPKSIEEIIESLLNESGNMPKDISRDVIEILESKIGELRNLLRATEFEKVMVAIKVIKVTANSPRDRKILLALAAHLNEEVPLNVLATESKVDARSVSAMLISEIDRVNKKLFSIGLQILHPTKGIFRMVKI